MIQLCPSLFLSLSLSLSHSLSLSLSMPTIQNTHDAQTILKYEKRREISLSWNKYVVRSIFKASSSATNRYTCKATMSMCVFIYICTHTHPRYIYTCTRKRIFTHVHTTQRNTCAIASSRLFRLQQIDTCSRELCVRMCIRAHTHTHSVYIYTYTHTYTCTHTTEHIYSQLRLQGIFVYSKWIHVLGNYVYVCIYTCMYARTHTLHIYTQNYVYIYTHSHTNATVHACSPLHL